MSSLFSDLSNVRMPDVVMNAGPLPTSIPAEFGATTDARINYGSTLLGDVQPYEYGEPRRLANQMNYRELPHKIQKIVLELNLPDSQDKHRTFLLSHGIDDGDIAFVLRVHREAGTLACMNTFDRSHVSYATDPFVNLATVNYLLAGVQRNWQRYDQKRWHQFMVDTDFQPPATQHKKPFTVQDAIRFIQDVARPFGIAHGSEKQGGQHQGSTAPVTYPVDFVTTLGVSGRMENLVNMWRELDVSAGDDLIMHLEWLPICKADGSMEYVLNHWKKGTTRKKFAWEEGNNMAWQLVPSVLDLHRPKNIHEGYDWRQHGYWHICRTQVMKGLEVTQGLQQRAQGVYCDDSRLMRGSLLEINFEPVFVKHGPLPSAPKETPKPKEWPQRRAYQSVQPRVAAQTPVQVAAQPAVLSQAMEAPAPPQPEPPVAPPAPKRRKAPALVIGADGGTEPTHSVTTL
jgi:hypothetical protein